MFLGRGHRHGCATDETQGTVMEFRAFAPRRTLLRWSCDPPTFLRTTMKRCAGRGLRLDSFWVTEYVISPART